jgi:hypothetical protein
VRAVESVDCSIMVSVLAGFAAAPQVNADKPTTLASRDDLTDFTRHRCLSFLRKETWIPAIRTFWFSTRTAVGFTERGKTKMTKGALLAAFSHCGSGILVQSLPRPEINFRHASYLSWTRWNLGLGVDPTSALGYD